LLTSKSTFLTFDLLGLLKRLSPFSTEPSIIKLFMMQPQHNHDFLCPKIVQLWVHPSLRCAWSKVK